MGNNSNSLKGLDSRFQELGIDENQLLSTLIVVQDINNKEKLLVKQMNIASDLEYARLLKELKQRKTLSQKKLGKYLISLRDVEGREQSQICGKSFKLLLYLQYLSGNLKTVFSERVRSACRFEEDQLLQLLKQIVNGLIILHDNNFKNIHIYKETIFITSANTYKLLDTQLCNRIHPYFQILNGIPPKTGTYLAPQLLEDIRKDSNDFYQSPKADIFTFAVILLELATLSTLDRYYNYEKKTVDVVGLHKVVEQLHFSPSFRQILHCMLREEQEQRVGLISLRQMMSSSDTLPNEQGGANSSIHEAGYPIKQTARTFISRSKKNGRESKAASVQKQTSANLKTGERVIQMPKSYRPISEYISNIPSKDNHSMLSKRSVETVQPAHQNHHNRIQIPSFSISHQNYERVIEVKNTPKAQSTVQFRFEPKEASQHFSVKPSHQYETPVNALVHPHFEPESTPINKIQELNTQRKEECQIFTTQMFNNKTYGRHIFSNNAVYEGQFNVQGQFDGNGMLYYPNGSVCYSGSWKNNSFHGFGVLHNEHPEENGEETQYWNLKLGDSNWSYYEGQFNMDRKEGFGTLYMINGDKFSGCFKNDTVEGFGTFYICRDQKNINGIWINNVLQR